MSTCRHQIFCPLVIDGYHLFPISPFELPFWISWYPSYCAISGGNVQLTDHNFICNDDNPKIIEIEFDTGSLQKNDVWHLCEFCSQKPEFQKFRLNMKNLKDCENK